MEELVIFRDRQELQAADLNNMQTYVDDAIMDVVMDAITTEKMFVGLGVTKKSATEITVASGRLWDGSTGKRYAKSASEDVSVYSYLPVSDEKYLNISVIGQETSTDQEPRDYLTDLTSGTTEPKSLYMTTAREVAIQITAGLESSSPQKPDAPTSYTTIAYVLLSTSGIQSIELASNKNLMQLYDVYQTVLTLAAWIASATPKLASLMSDMANLAAKINSIRSPKLVTQLAADVALIREELALPTNYTEYEADNFLDPGESDTANALYHALVQEGVRFPWAGLTEQQLALFNPYETGIQNFNGLIIPAHTLVARLQTTGVAGTLLLSQYQYQTVTSRQCTRTRVRTTYSSAYTYCTNGSSWGKTDETTVVEQVFEGTVPDGISLGDSNYTEYLGEVQHNDNHQWLTARDVWVHAWLETYWVVDSTTNTIQGSITAQTILNSQNGWLRKIGLTFAAKASDGAVNLLLCNCTSDGLPNLHRVIGSAVVQPADIKVDGTETLFELAQPVFLAPGARYALVLVTAGAHSVNLVEGTEYSQGTLFYSTDGQYFQGDFTKDLQMSLYFAQFSNVRTVINLTPISLAEGIVGFDILSEQIVPSATSLVLQYQASGTGDWTSIEAGTADALLGLPAMCNLRAVFNGSQDIMPGLGLSGSKMRANRPGTSFRHLSTLRTLGTASSDIDVILRLENWDATKHACTVTLLADAVTYTGTVSDETLDDGIIRRTVNFTPATPLSHYQIVIEGTTSTALKCYHVASRMDVAK